MHVDGRIVNRRVAGARPPISEVGWFVARQPGIVRFLDSRLDRDVLAIALDAAWQIVLSFHQHDGVPPPRVSGSLLERALATIDDESAHPEAVIDGCAERQPALVEWVVGLISDPPVPLTAGECSDLGRCLAAVIYAVDQVTTGRPVR